MIKGCDCKGFDVVEYDNLDFWMWFDGILFVCKVLFDKLDVFVYVKVFTCCVYECGFVVG